MSEMKMEILGKCARKEQLKDLQTQIDQIRDQPEQAALNPELMQEI